MKTTIKKITALTLTSVLLCGAVSCGKRNEDISNSRKNTQDGRIVLSVDTPYVTGQIASAVSEYNRSQDSCMLEVKNYYTTTEMNEDPSLYDKAVAQMKLDMASGKCCDIIAVPADQMQTLIKLDMFTDMYELMEQYDGLKKEDLLPNILEGFEVGGELPAISYMFTIRTAVAKTKYVGENTESWTPQQAMEAFEAMSEDMVFVAGGSSQRLAEYMTAKSVSDYVDFETNTCNFTDGRFGALIDFSAENGINEDYESEALVKQVIMYGFNGQTANFYDYDSGINGEEVTFVGYPSENGCGAKCGCGMVFAINKNCAYKEQAWDFICSMFTENYQKHIREKQIEYGFPMLKSVFDMMAFEYDTEAMSHNNMWFGIIRTHEQYPETSMDPEAAVMKLYNYLTNLKFQPYSHEALENIVEEEYASVLAGEKTGEQCGELTENRISIYLSERS